VIPGVLLTGGASRRMGTDKATLPLGDATFATRAAAVLATVCAPVVEVGPGVTGLRAVREDPVGSGPLAAFLAGVDALAAPGSVFLLACDLPFVDAVTLAAVADHAGAGSVVPVVAGRPQYACARWSAAAIAAGRAALGAGERALRVLADVDAESLAADALAPLLADVDTPEDLRRLGLS
jgi:molybdopterin-guanine dinucleotide biosynthesis protein A